MAEPTCSNNQIIPHPIYFLRTAKCSVNMSQAFESLNRDCLSPVWIDLEEVKKLVDEKPGSILIVDSIDSRVYRKVHKMCQKKRHEPQSEPESETEDKPAKPNKLIPLRIFTAFALISINPKSIRQFPLSKYPISSICMKNCHVTFSGLNASRAREVTRKTFGMNAPLKLGLHKRTSYIIADTWTANKVIYLRRHREDFCVVKSEWVDRCWEMRENLKDAKDLVDNYRLPIFAGMHFCVSGFNERERTKICRDVKSNGGTYSQSLNLPSYRFEGVTTQTRSQIAPNNSNPLTTHLIVNDKKGVKFQAAMNLKDPKHVIHIVNHDWFVVSKDRGFPQPEDHPSFCAKDEGYMLNLKKAELAKRKRAVLDCSQSSDNSIENSQLDMLHTQEIPKAVPMDPFTEISNLLASNVNSDIFSELSFYICGFTTVQYISAKKIVNSAKGTIYSNLSAPVTHVLIGPQITSKETLAIKRHYEKSPVARVDLKWVVECIREKLVKLESVDEQIAKLLGQINSTQDLDPQERMEVYRARAEPKSIAMEKKLKELSEATEVMNRNNVNKKGLKIGAGNTAQYAPIMIKRKPQNESLECSIPCDYSDEL